MRSSHRWSSTSLPSGGPIDQHKKSNPAGAFDALEHTGIPTRWLRRPKLPSRNWLVFWGVVSSISCLYWYDRRQCRLIKEEYISTVRHLAEAPLGTKELPRRADVYACKWPGDDEYDRSLKFFKRYVKPILVAAAVDYALRNGNQYGAISDLIRDKAKDQRREQLGVYSPASPWKPQTTNTDRAREYEQWLQGGIILIGRHTFKEYMHGLQQGWTESLEKVDEEEMLANRLSEDGRFDEPEEALPAEVVGDDIPSSVLPLPQPTVNSPPLPQSKQRAVFAPLGGLQRPPQPRQPQPQQNVMPTPDGLAQIPQAIPQHPPLLLVYYPNRLGFLNIPLIIADFFNERKNVRIGCEAAYSLIMNETRPIIPPTSTSNTGELTPSSAKPGLPLTVDSISPPLGPMCMGHGGDLDFALDSEANFGKSFGKLPITTAKARESYYSELPAKLGLARDLARGEREPTGDEQAYPPPTEVELRAQRLSKEKKWTSDEQAWMWLRAGSGVAWDDRFRDALRVFDTSAGVANTGAFGSKQSEPVNSN